MVWFMTRPLITEARPEIVVATMQRPQGTIGVDTHVQTFVKHLPSVSRPVTLVTPFSSSSPLVRPVFGVRKALSLFDSSAGVGWYHRWHEHYLRDALQDVLTRPSEQVVYAQCPYAAAAALTAGTAPVVMAVHFHESQSEDFVVQGELRRDHKVFREIRAFEEQVIPRVHGIVYVSDFTRQTLEHRMPHLAAIPHQVTHLCVDPIERTPRPRDGELIMVGGLEPRKNHSYLLKIVAAAAAMGRTYRLTVVGGGTEKERLEAEARDLGIDGHVRFTGRVPDSRALMARHQLYVHTATMENFGVALLEAMAEGLPVLAAPVGGSREVFREGIDGEYWPLDDSQEAARILIALMNDESRRATMANSAVQRAAEFSIAAQSGKLLDFLDHIAAVNAGGECAMGTPGESTRPRRERGL